MWLASDAMMKAGKLTPESIQIVYAESTDSDSEISESESDIDRSRRKRYDSVKKFVFGLIIVCIIACSWVGSTQTAKSAYTSNFKAPFFSMWFSTAWMIILFPLSAPLYILTQGKGVMDLWKLVA